ncbi:AP endonuclease [Mesorhizobium sp. NBSH29]|uniref:endonuclease/exonuclease/phosphatase family protein n=1 Tax=Mesorhizobium sp. NBSH29 TaxID=2654249 RepID=UPI0018965F49|nr:endonuclease/exonuclease/phosphatase family protein [Mesorhizobium sp. NBSH29]QPC87243.1 AP endonuclease [Mesorhizobium sp. NBSH29]
MILRTLLPLATFVLAALLSLSFLGRVHPAFDSIAHFRGHLAVLLAVGAALLLASGLWKEGALGVVFALAALWSVSASYSFSGIASVHAAVPQADAPVYRLLQMNLRFDNQSPENVLSLIARTRPDVITLNEVSAQWKPALDRIEAAYPHRIFCAGRSHVGGVALLSRRPFSDTSPARCFARGSLAIAAVDFGGETVDVAALHLGWPWPRRQAAQIDAISGILATLGDAAILAGDFNATGWSTATRRVAEAGGLTPTDGIGATWLHRKLPKSLRRWVGLPIDQVMGKGRLTVQSAKVETDAGSDHLPILVTFTISPRPTEPDEAAPAITVDLGPTDGQAS